MRKVVFFDRDGTLIVDKIYLNDPEQIIYLPGAFESLRILRDRGYEFVVVTNQSGVARGLVDTRNLREIHRRIRAEFNKHGVDFLDFLYAPYMTDTDHFLRKPNPGMLLEAAINFKVHLGHSWMVGDRMTDVEAGHRAGTRSILIHNERNGENENPAKSEFEPPEAEVKSLLELIEIIR